MQFTAPTTSEFDNLLVDIHDNIDLFNPEELAELERTLKYVDQLERIERARTDFRTFVELCGAPYLKFSSKGQHDLLAKTFEQVVFGDLKRVTIAMAPRMGKSEFGSILLPAWFIGNSPEKKIMQLSAKEDLATDFGRKVKAIIESPMYQKVFPGVRLSKDSKASGKFATSKGGEYFALGITSGQAGKGGDLIICDDLTNEQDARSGDPAAFESAWALFQSGPMHRLQPGGRIIIIQTRWSNADIIGKVHRAHAEDPSVDKYEAIVFPALDDDDESTFPEIWPTDEIRKKRANLLKASPQFWWGPYMQKPTAAENSLIPSACWRKWDKYRPVPGSIDMVDFEFPDCKFVIATLDTAETANKRSNPTACTIWGIFEYKDPESKYTRNCLCLLHSYTKKVEFHNLKRVAKEWIHEWNPDAILVEAKSTGPALRSELHEAGIFTEAVRPKPNEDKHVRLAAVAGVFHSGNVFYIPTGDNQQTIDQVAEFPNGEFDDLVDTVSYSVQYFRKGGLVRTNEDERAEEPDTPRTRAYY